MIHSLLRWLSHPAVDWSLALFSVLALVASVLLVPRFLATLPPDYLVSARFAGSVSTDATTGSSFVVRVLRNLLGVVLLLLGIAMLVLPGQGLLTVLVGLLLIDFPGKTQLVRRVLSRPKVLSVVNKLRAHRNAAPLTAA